MITKELIDPWLNNMGVPEQVKFYLKQFLKERDAYREVAILKSGQYLNHGNYEATAKIIDADVKHLISEKAAGKI